MRHHLLPAALLFSLATSPALAQPAGGIGTAQGPSGGIAGSGTLNPSGPASGTITTPGTNMGGTTLSTPGTPSSAGYGNNSGLATMPSGPATATPSTPSQAPAGGVPGTNAGVPGVNQP